MKMSEMFPSKYLKCDDLEGSRKIVTIVGIKKEDVNIDRPPSPVLYLDGCKPVVLNRTNCMAIAEMYGDESDGWIGKKVMLCPERTQFQGKMHPCIRIYAPPRAGAPASGAAAPAPARGAAVPAKRRAPEPEDDYPTEAHDRVDEIDAF